MEQIFLKVLNISISASILIIVVIAARLLLKKAPKWCVMLLWAIVALRLVIPVSIESAFSLIPRGMDEKIESIETAVMDRNTDQEQIPQAEANNMPVTVNGGIQEDVTYIPYEIVETTEPVKRELSIFEIAGYIWIAGVGLMLMFSLFSYIKLKLRMAESVKYKDNIYLSDRTTTAFILGMIRTRIYLPSGIDEKEIPYVIAHEFSHIKRGDHLWKPLAYLLLCVYWFNPLMWLAYSLLSRDIEYACDERTVSGYDMKDRKAYAAALLENSIQKKLVMVCPLAFGEGSIKERVRKVLDHKKPAFWICIVSLAVVAIVGICFATKPKNDGDTAVTEEGGVATEDGALVASQDTEENKVGTKEWYWPSVSPIEANKEADNNIEVVEGQPDTEYKLNTEYLPAQTIAADSKLWQPPTVTITYAGRAYVATQGTYHWSYVNADNEAVEISADTAHPLDMVERITHIYKVNSVDDIVLDFSLTPVKMVMRYWKLECAGDPDSYEKSAKSHFIYNADPVDGPSSLIIDIPEDVPIVVELSGEWKNGTSSYYFTIMPEEPAGESVADWMDIRLPEGFILSQYSDYNGHMGGYNILPQAYTVDTHVNSVNWSWLISGVITRLPASNVQLVFTDKHAPYFGAESRFYMDNHTDQEYIKTITLERRPDGWYALEFSEDHDLYTFAQLYELEQQGVEIEEDKRISSYYVFWYVKEDAGTYYMISFAKNKFTQEQAEKIATSVTILE